MPHTMKIPSADYQGDTRCSKCGKLEPDSFYLNDYILLNFPEVYTATKYISNYDIQLACWREIWNKHTDCEAI